MDKSRQSELVRWLKLQAAPARKWLRLSMLLGVFSGLLIIAQAWCLAILLQSLIMEHVPREQLLTPFAILIALFVVRAIVAAHP